LLPCLKISVRRWQRLNYVLVDSYRAKPKSPLIAAQTPFEQQEDGPMKMTLAVVAFATLASSVLAEPSASARFNRTQKRHIRSDHRYLSLPAQKPGWPPPGPAPTDPSLCRTAPGFCADYHGQNG
jgi:hypothetical protein